MSVVTKISDNIRGDRDDIMQTSRKKLNLAVKSDFQKWLLVRIFGVVLLSSLAAALILYFYARQEIGESFYEAHIKIRHVSDLLWPVVLAGSAVSLISGMLLAIFLPQKIAGPIFRIEKDLEAVRQGDLTVEITLRRGDILRDFAANLNQTILSLRTKVARAQKGCERLAEQEKDDPAIAEVCEELRTLKT